MAGTQEGNIYIEMFAFQAFSNLLADPVCASEITKNPQFNWPVILALMQSKYLAIQQVAITIVEQLVSRFRDHIIQKTFKTSTGVLDLCDILEVGSFPICLLMIRRNSQP